MNFEEGAVILIDKPLEWTSFDVVSKIRNTIRVKKVGHAGTLDPLATGLLILCSGKMTKKIEEFQAQEKEYEGELVLGKTTPSYDLETAVDKEFDISLLSEEKIREGVKPFIGVIQQVPPVYSAIKVDGVPLYKKARRGEEVEIKSREVTVKEFEITDIELPVVKFRVVCSKGTYIRSLVHDFGVSLRNGAYMSALRRTRIGAYHVKDAEQLTTFVEKNKKIKQQE
ncbi:MAG TPA: tRNA pseudouridine(55) synthase TruB [Cytophagaceae bacterium]|jgi:tRNA pseudouridine55 synthase|nr:tRNA pseudouridine(55) synthase TruB [Cytophagaceae bacterium]